MTPPWMRIVSLSPGLTLFDSRTGRDIVLPAVGDPAALERHPRLLRSGFLDPLNPDALIPHRKAHPLFLPLEQSLLCPDPTRHPPGGRPWRTFRLEPRSLALWAHIDGCLSVTQLAQRLDFPTEEALARLGGLAGWGIQAVLLREQRVRPDHPSLLRVVGPAREPNAREPSMYAEKATALGAFHDALEDAASRFDLAETTLAHALAPPHPGLQGQPYGARLCDTLIPSAAESPRVLEVGGGTGELGAAFLARAAERGINLSYLRVDRSPALLAAQASRMPHTEGRVGDALALPVPNASIDLLIANEVIADLPATRTETGWTNDGALAFIAEIARVLAPGGRAFVSEFGSEADEPEETEQLDHPEVSIRFDRLVERARALGLTATLTPIAELLGMDLNARWLWRPHLGALRHLDHRAGRPPTAARAWTAATLQLPEAVEGLRWVPLHDEGPGPLPARTWGLSLSSPACATGSTVDAPRPPTARSADHA